jgi:hypothetical protein
VTFKIAGRDFIVGQAAGPCTYSLTPDRLEFSENGGDKNVTVTTQAHCSVTSSSNVSWIRVTPTTRTGTGQFAVKVERNRSINSRSGAVTFSGQNFERTVTVTQDGDNDD